MPAPYADIFPRQLELNGFELLSITTAHCVQLLALPLHHRDPFDRILVAQAQTEGMILVTDDGKLHAYGVPLLW